MNKELCASIFVIDPDTKKILLVRHKEFQKWVQPGGHLEDNEIPEETAAREVYEETGIKVKIMGDRFPTTRNLEQSEPQEHQSNPCSVWLMWQEFLD